MITDNALIKRIRRELAHKGHRLCLSRSNAERNNLGDAYTVDYCNIVADYHLDLREYGLALGVITAAEAQS